MKKLIVTCTAVAYAIAFIGCEGANTELPEDENPIGDEPGATGGDLEGGGEEPISGGGAGGGSEE